MKYHQKNLPIHTVTFPYKGTVYQGSYTVDGEYVTVTYGMATKTATFDPYQRNPERIASLLLSELVMEGKKGS